jgi:hypothetical protein
MSDTTTTEIRPVAIERSQGGSLSSPTNNGIIINWGSSGGGSAAPSPSPVSVVPNFLIPAAIFAVAGAVVFQLIGQGISNFQNQQLQAQNQQLIQQLAAQQAQIEGVKSLVCVSKN